jgi:alpha-L-rhamnosidase
MMASYLRCESLIDPIGIDTDAPRFSWIVSDEDRGACQLAWQIEVRDALSDVVLWDSGRIDSESQHHIAYAGDLLRSFQDCGWRLRLWNEEEEPGAWSDWARFVCGFLGEDSFGGQWIHYPVSMLPDATFFRRSFRIEKEVARAYLAVTARGIVEPHLDGERIGEDYFQPGWTDYTQRFHYRVYDCRDRMAVGEHRLGGIVAEGWWRGQVGNHASGKYGEVCMMLAELRLQYTDGSSETMSSDDGFCL